MTFSVAIVGKPNVGKSTLFNRLCGKRLAIVEDIPGVTRDRKEYQARLSDLSFKLIDTAGWENEKLTIKQDMIKQSQVAISEAAITFFMLDGQQGISYDDIELANALRRSHRAVILLINKSEGKKSIDNNEIYRLGLGEPIFISAQHGLGMDELYMRMTSILETIQLPLAEEENNIIEEDNALRIAIIGRPNVGKSTLFNQILGEERAITSEIAGTTRDAINYKLQVGQRNIELIDTAGVRKRKNIDSRVEDLSVGESINAIRRCHIAILVVDATIPLEKQDLSIVQIAINEGRGIILVVNKYDLIKDTKTFRQEIEYLVSKNLSGIQGVPIVYTSALKGKNVDEILEVALLTEARWVKKINTGKLNRWLQDATTSYIPPLAHHGRRIRLKYATQTSIKPPTFSIFANVPEDLPDSYTQYLSNSMRKAFDLHGIPLRINYRKIDNPYDRQKKDKD